MRMYKSDGYSLLELLLAQTFMLLVISALNSAQTNLLVSIDKKNRELNYFWYAQDLAARLELSSNLWLTELSRSYKRVQDSDTKINIRHELDFGSDVEQWEDYVHSPEGKVDWRLWHLDSKFVVQIVVNKNLDSKLVYEKVLNLGG